jgi:hypothetical protein
MKSIPLASILLGTLLTLWLVTASQPLRPGPINVTREQYDAELAKWNSLDIADYEETITYSSDSSWKIVVHINRNTGTPVESITHFDRLDGRTTSNKDIDFVKGSTVGALFHDLDKYVRDPFRHDLEITDGSEYTSLDVTFDPAMGYPDSLALLSYPGSHGTFGDTVSTVLTVNVKILK